MSLWTDLLSVQHRLSEMHIITENFSNAFSRSTSPVPNLPEYNLTHEDLYSLPWQMYKRQKDYNLVEYIYNTKRIYIYMDT